MWREQEGREGNSIRTIIIQRCGVYVDSIEPIKGSGRRTFTGGPGTPPDISSFTTIFEGFKSPYTITSTFQEREHFEILYTIIYGFFCLTRSPLLTVMVQEIQDNESA